MTAAVETGSCLEEPELLSIPDSTEAGQAYRDRTTGLPLDESDPALTQQGRAVEMQYMKESPVLEDSDLDGIDFEDWAATFAAAPPYEAFRLQLGLLMTGPRSEVEGNDEVLMLRDIPKAHLHSPLRRVIFEKINEKVYRLWKAMNGLRDVGASFDQKELDMMDLMSKFSSCTGHRRAGDSLMQLVRWEDDPAKHREVKTAMVLGPDAEKGDAQGAVHLNRLLKLYPPGAEGEERVELEASPRHVEPQQTLQMQLRLEAAESKVMGTPRVRLMNEEDEKELDVEECACRRSGGNATSARIAASRSTP